MIIKALLHLILFLSSFTLIKRAQTHDFLKLDGQVQYPLRNLFPFEDNSNGIAAASFKDSLDDGNIQRVVTILQNNIKQWSFIESQLLEPNVNLGMPEIFIPLKHLTTTLEILGNIFFVKNQLFDAKDCLERACPLMELLPASINEGNSGGRNYAEGCFALLREVYVNIYGSRSTVGSPIISDTPHISSPSTPIPTANNNVRKSGRRKEKKYKKLVQDDFMNSNRKSKYVKQKFDDKYNDNSKRKSSSFQEKSNDDTSNGNDDENDDIENDDHNADSYFEENNSISNDDNFEFERNSDPDLTIVESTLDIDRKIEELRLPYDHLRSELIINSQRSSHSSAAIDDIDIDEHSNQNQQFAFLPRSLLSALSRNPPAIIVTDPNKIASGTMPRDYDMLISDENLNHNNFDSIDDHYGDSSDKHDNTQSQTSFYGVSSKKKRNKKSRKRGKMILNDDNNVDINELHEDVKISSLTSVIADDLEDMLKRFVQEDEEGKKSVLMEARKYYDDLDLKFPTMNYNEYAANMDLGQVYLDVMSRINEEGFQFISPELERWQEIGQSMIIASSTAADAQQMNGATITQILQQKSKNDREIGIIWEIDPVTGTKREFEVELDSLNSFSLADR
eukprot:gene13959-18723_t